jgi:hypothetical protein
MFRYFAYKLKIRKIIIKYIDINSNKKTLKTATFNELIFLNKIRKLGIIITERLFFQTKMFHLTEPDNNFTSK